MFQPSAKVLGPSERIGIPGKPSYNLNCMLTMTGGRFTFLTETRGANPSDLVVEVTYGKKKIPAQILSVAENDKIIEEEKKESVGKGQITPRRKRLMELTSSSGGTDHLQAPQPKPQPQQEEPVEDLKLHKRSFSSALRQLASPRHKEKEKDTVSPPSKAGASATTSASTSITQKPAVSPRTPASTPPVAAPLSLVIVKKEDKKNDNEEKKSEEMKKDVEKIKREENEQDIVLQKKNFNEAETVVIAFILPAKEKSAGDDEEKVNVVLYPREDENSKDKLTISLIEKPVARIISLDGPQLVSVPMTCMLELVNLKPEQLDGL